MTDHQPEDDAKPSDRSEKDLFLAALEIEDPGERAAWLEEACGDDAALHARLGELLEAEEEEDGDEFLEPDQDRLGEVVSAVGRELREDEADTMLSDVGDEPTPGGEAGMSEQVGDTIGRYKLLQKLGEGGGGVVYLAKQTEPVKRKVALKVIKLGMDTRQVVARFEAERQALAMMDHPNIAKVLDGGATTSGRPYFVMEVVRGVPITKFCDDNNLSTVERLELFTQVCEAVQHAHQKGIIHRDLKPGNILVTMLEDRPLPKVIDFGIAKATQQELSEKTIFTQMGHFIGTPAYMSPEQAQLTEYDIDTRSDIYALGVVLYELLTGSTPLDSEKLRSAAYDEMQRLIREEPPEKPSTRLSTSRTGQTGRTRQTPDPRALRGDLDWIVMKALEKDRRRRYETANALALDVGRHLRNEPVAAGPPTAGYRLKKFVRRNRRALLSGAVAAVALLGGLSVAGVMWLNERERVAEVQERAGTLIGQAEDRMEANAAAEDYYDDEAFRRAEALADQLKLLGDLDRAGEELRTRRDQLVAEVQSERRNRDLILGIEEALMMRMGTGGGGSVDAMRTEVEKSFAAAFKLYGKNPAEAPVDDTIAWLEPRREEVRDRILAGMLEWADLLKENAPERAGRLAAVVATMDPDPWREQLRRAIDEEDRAALEQLAASEEVSGQTIMTVLNLAHALREAESWAVIEKLLRRAQREHPENFWTNFALADILGDRLDGAAYALGEEGVDWTFFLSVIEESQLNPELRPEYDEAIGFLRAAVAARPDASMGWISLGASLRNGGRLEDAVASYLQAIKLKPDFALTHLNLGLAVQGQGKLDEAITSYREAIKLDPDLAAAHSNLGGALTQKGRLDEAVASLERAIKLDPTMAVFHVNLGLALKGQGKLDEAIASYETAIRLDPDFAGAHSMLGVALRDKGELDRAIASYRNAIEKDPDFVSAHVDLGLALFDQGKLDEAIASYRSAIEVNADSASAHNNLGNALIKQDKVEEAITHYLRAIELDPESATARNNLGWALKEQGELKEAIASYRKATELDPDYAGAYLNLGIALQEQGNFDDAIASYRKAIKLDPDDASVHFNLGVALEKQGKLDDAIASYQFGIKLDPDNAMAHVNLGVAFQKQGKTDEAIASSKTAVEVDPGNALAHSNLGAALMRQGKLDEASTWIRKAIELDPGHAGLHGNFGSVLAEQGKLDEAIAAYLESLRLEPNPQQQSAIERLKKMDTELLGIVREKGAEDPSVRALAREVYGKLEFRDPPQDRIRGFWEENREEVAEALGSAEVRIITLLKNHPEDFTRTAESAKVLAQELAGKLAAGADFGELAKEFSDTRQAEGGLQRDVTWGEELSEPLDLAAFTLKVGAISEVIEVPKCYFLLKVEKRLAGKADDFDDPKVREVAAALLTAQRRKDMEQAYLERLQERIEEERAGKPAENAD